MMDTQQGGILGITNRTENWKTAQTFAPFLGDSEKSATLRLELAKCLGEPDSTKPQDVKLELFWKGFRDYFEKADPRPGETEIHRTYKDSFPNLREDLERFWKQNYRPEYSLKEHNYSDSTDHRSPPNQGRTTSNSRFLDNVLNTEIDIVLTTPSCLFIGEAKLEHSFDAKSKYVLVHQLIRQYVMATILTKLLGSKRKVIPFVVYCPQHTPELPKTLQVGFMEEQRWLSKDNILTWQVIKELAKE